MTEFFGEWYGILAFALFAAVITVLIITVNYRWFFKRALDIFCSLIAIIVTSPFALGVAIAFGVHAQKDGGRDVFKRTYYVGKNGKVAYSLRFNTTDKNGKEDSFGRKIKPFSSIPALYDVFSGRFSFIGPMPMPLYTDDLIGEEDYERFKLRPGLINPLILRGENNTRNYEKMFRADRIYVKKHGLFKDIRVFIVFLGIKARGSKKNYIGVPETINYADYLLKNGEISGSEYDKAMESEEKKLERVKKRKELKKRMTNYHSDD